MTRCLVDLLNADENIDLREDHLQFCAFGSQGNWQVATRSRFPSVAVQQLNTALGKVEAKTMFEVRRPYSSYEAE